MYTFLRRYVPARVADWLMVCWYLGLLLLVLYYIGEPSGQFRYAHW